MKHKQKSTASRPDTPLSLQASHTNPMAAHSPRPTFLQQHWLSLLGLFLLLAGVFFRSFLPGLTTASGDCDILGLRNALYARLPHGYVARWMMQNAFGGKMTAINLIPGNLLAHLFPFTKYADANYVFHLFILAILSYFLFLDMKCRRHASFLGAAWMMLQPHVVSHILPGHVGHLQMIAWIPGIFLFLRLAIRRGDIAFWGLAGSCMGLAISSGTLDVALFFSLVAGAYGIFLLILQWRERRHAQVPAMRGLTLRIAGGVIAAAILCMAIGYQAIIDNIVSHLQGSEAELNDPSSASAVMDDHAKYLWATQWSVPVEETIDLALPGFFGWGSSNPANPYRGGVGQTEGFPQHRQGLPNLNDVSNYLGAVILLASLVAVWARRRDPEVWFFVATGLTGLLLSYGKHAPFYRFFYVIPYMDTMRNPIKWFYITSFVAGIVGTLGLASAFRVDAAKPSFPSRLKLAATLVTPGVLFLVASAIFLMNTERFVSGLFWRNPSALPAALRSLGIGALFWFGAATIFYGLLRPQPTPQVTAGRPGSSRVLPILVSVLLLAELLYLDLHYIPYKPSVLPTNGGVLAEYLDRQEKPWRIHFAVRDPAIDQFLVYLSGYYGWEFLSPGASRTVDEISLFLRALSSNPRRMLALGNAKFLISQDKYEDPFLKLVSPLNLGRTAIYLYEITQTLPRYYLVPGWRHVPPEKRFEAVAAPEFDPSREALIHAPQTEVPSSPSRPAQTLSCRVTRYEWQEIQIATTADADTMLVGLDRYDPAWHAYVDGREVPLWKANGMLRACPVPAGNHTVTLRLVGQGYRPLVIVLCGWAATLLLVVWVLIRPRLGVRSSQRSGGNI